MAGSEDLINFDLIETQKENIQSLPQGRSAKALATALGPSPFSPIAAPGSTRSLNDAIRADYEKELQAIGDSDDPLDIYDRYVKWTLNAYPSAQATPESQLRSLLERATKAFQNTAHYKNDPRYVKLWMTYIRFFSDAPRETFAYLSRHSIGEGLAIFYEEFAAWLEQASRWTQAEEVYKMGIEREARPTERLLRKFGEFQKRSQHRPADSDGPSSPALPTVRPALAAKVDPFESSSSRPLDPQSQRLPSQSKPAKTGKSKLAIFSDSAGEGSSARPTSRDYAQGWDSLGTVAERKKENVMGAKPWVGETLKVGKKAGTIPKMMVYKDQSVQKNEGVYSQRSTTNAKTGRVEHVFVNLEAVYPNPNDLTEEYSFAELRARHRGWLDKKWMATKTNKARHRTSEETTNFIMESQADMTLDMTTADVTSDMTIGGTKKPRKDRSGKLRKKRVVEVKGETQTVKTNLDSPTNRKVRRKNSSEPTMTLHTRAANDEILDIFSQPLQKIGQLGGTEYESVDEGDYDTDDYTSGAESTMTGRISGVTSEYGDDVSVRSEAELEDSESDIKSVSPWSDFTKSKHMPAIESLGTDRQVEDDSGGTSSHEEWRTAAELPTTEQEEPNPGIEEELVTPTAESLQEKGHRSVFIPIPPEDIEVPTHPYRDSAQIMQSRLPFMTPIVEKTESSLSFQPAHGDYFYSKTPCRRSDNGDDNTLPQLDKLLLDSSVPDDIEDDTISRPARPRFQTIPEEKVEDEERKNYSPLSPVINDAQCNPVGPSIRAAILAAAAPYLQAMANYHDHRPAKFGRAAELRRFVKSTSKSGKANDRTSAGPPPTLVFSDGSDLEYALKRELGKGAFAPVYLATILGSAGSDCVGESIAEERYVALKAEDPPTPWEFYMMSLAHRRLCHDRAASSLARPEAMHLFADEGYLVESYHAQGTLLDLANASRNDPSSGGASPPLLDETAAIFFAAELLRTVESLHSAGVLHGDIKADNVLVRLDTVEDAAWSSAYSASGAAGWDAKGVTLIDFGRATDLHAFAPGVAFVADWKTDRHDCPEMRDLRPWTFQADYWGVAGVLHVLLFGKWIDDVAESAVAGESGLGASKRYRLREPLRRYWQTDLWAAAFDALMNPGPNLPNTARIAEARCGFETWLAENAERRGLKAGLRRIEERVAPRRR